MNKKYLIFTVTLLFTLLPIIVFGSGGSQTLKFFKGDGDIEQWFLNAFTLMNPQVSSEAKAMSRLGRSIGAIGAMAYLGYLGWEMLEGQRPWAVTPMIKPVIIGLILINWYPFARMIQSPFEMLAKPSVAMFNDLAEKSEDLRIKRYELQWTLVSKAVKIEAENQAKKDEENIRKAKEEGFFSGKMAEMGSEWNELKIKLYEWELKTASTLQTLLAEIIEAIALIILRVCVYGIFAFQKLWSMILIILGPIAVGMSLIPGFDGALQSWISKFVNINLWTFIAFKAMTIGEILITSGYKMEINRYDSILQGSEDEIIANVGNFVNGAGFINVIVITCVAYIVTGLLTLMTPTIADSIVSAGGSGVANAARQAMSTMSGGTKKVVTTGGKMIGNTGRNTANAAKKTRGKFGTQKGGVTPKF